MRNYPAILTALILLMIISCSSPPDVTNIIDKAIEAHGGDRYANSKISFDFRGTDYRATHDDGTFRYVREIETDSLGMVTDSLWNGGFTRMHDGQKIALAAEDSTTYANSLNSVVYFVLLPYKLNDAAVNKNLLAETNINEEPYYKIEVTFDKQSGGTDYQDRYIYWIHRKNYTMDYLAYRFHVDDGGTRFREAYNVRTINGLRFADYNNFGGPDMERPLEDYESYFKADTLNKVSEINLDSISVELLR